MEQVAARHIGVSVSSGGIRYALQRLWNPRTEKGLLAVLRRGGFGEGGRGGSEADGLLFDEVETSCEAIAKSATPAEGAVASDRPHVEGAASGVRTWWRTR